MENGEWRMEDGGWNNLVHSPSYSFLSPLYLFIYYQLFFGKCEVKSSAFSKI